MYNRTLIGILLCATVASPAHALKVTNLDDVTHTIEISDRGSKTRYVLEAGSTEHITGASQGVLSLVSAQKQKHAKGVLQSDGLLSGIVGAGRNQNIPVDPRENYVIWPDGDLRLQAKRKYYGGR